MPSNELRGAVLPTFDKSCRIFTNEGFGGLVALEKEIFRYSLLLFNLLFMKSHKDHNTPTSKEPSPEIHFAYTILYVQDVPQTLGFYEEVFGFQRKLLTPEEDYGELVSGSTTLAFASLALGKANFSAGFQASDPQQKPFGIELAFTTQDVKGLMAKALQEGAILLEDALTKPWGQEVGYLRDINGFILEICTPVGN